MSNFSQAPFPLSCAPNRDRLSLYPDATVRDVAIEPAHITHVPGDVAIEPITHVLGDPAVSLLPKDVRAHLSAFNRSITMGFLRSYALLVPHRLDFVLSKFISYFRYITDEQVARRYYYGQLRLLQLNWAVRIFLVLAVPADDLWFSGLGDSGLQKLGRAFWVFSAAVILAWLVAGALILGIPLAVLAWQVLWGYR
ncbi:hypothetical protein QBC32DRAFT_383561 [Pseudoneurospora amorphoporcata]|uniref:Uncharacterized protein n=1 Tax=Pseudoneurospora amorphoporcata TaxID=241081 RepID=A0AAN6SB15_9PEZI|nr:hypothetical protein QBC32DRAFT_383561 [Pseudoneurospora amorphoporcata]